MSDPRPARIFVYGVRSRFAAEVAEIMLRLRYRHAVYVDNLDSGPEPASVEPIIGAADVPPPNPDHGFVIPIFAPGLRRRLHDELLAAGHTNFPALVDPTSVVASTATIADGVIVNAASAIASNTAIGRFVTVNRSVSIGHDNTIDDYVSLGPACVLTGHCRIGRGAFIGAGATIIPGVEIGANSVVGAGSVVLADVAPHTLIAGNPARAVKQIDGYDGLTV